MSVFPWLADALVVLALAVMTVGVYGVRRMPDVYTQLHATSKAVFLGVIAILVASAVSGDPEIILRLVLIGIFLLLTTPVSAHVVARAAYRRREPMTTPGAIDESGRGLTVSSREDERGSRHPRPELREIVVGYDGSEPSKRALERAAQIVAEDGRITLVTAGSILPTAPRAGVEERANELEERRRVLLEGRERLAQLGIRADAIEVVGDPADAIIGTARDLDADLIVVGTRGRNVAARVLLGSVSTTVVNQAPCDVLVVR